MADAVATSESVQLSVRKPALILHHIGRWLLTLSTLVIFCSSLAADAIYHLYVYGAVRSAVEPASIGVLAALSFALVHLSRQTPALRGSGVGWLSLRRVVVSWNLTIIFLLMIGFVSRQTADYSRATLVLNYILSLSSLLALHALFNAILFRGIREGWLATGRALIVGTPSRISQFLDRKLPSRAGMHVVDIVRLPELADPEMGSDSQADIDSAFRQAVGIARQEVVDDVYLLVPWSQDKLIDAFVAEFSVVPAGMYLGPERVMMRLGGGAMLTRPGVMLGRPPLGFIDRTAKRLFDVALASLSIVLMLPFLAVVSILIKLDSRGPVFFKQRRYGFNEQPFEILKLRTMRSGDDEKAVTQAARIDPRVTRVGWWLRRTSIDELPQLWNVLLGHMSLVGPRPHAVMHNLEFEKRVASYARRHNVRPGITGWAQVNGYRGETDTDEKLKARVDHDLYYIDNWSISFDLLIIFRTVFSRRALSNAY